jgi:hypothetical protein
MLSQNTLVAESAELQSLTSLVLSTELTLLEGFLGGFNVFRTLGLTEKEMAHSRILAWLLQPEESHGLGDLFLRRWLMRVVSDTESIDPKLPTAPELEAAEWVQIEVQTEVSISREERLDVLMKLRERGSGCEALWLVAVEVKIGAEEGQEQLSRYTDVLTKRFPNAVKQIFIYLTKNDLPPGDSAWIRCGFSKFLHALTDCLTQRSQTIGLGPRLLLENYKSLLEEEFIMDSKVVAAVRNILKTHTAAVELILKHRVDELQEWTGALRGRLNDAAAEAQIIIKDGGGKDYIEFAPAFWGQNLKLKKAAVLCVLEVDESGVGLRIYATNYCDNELKQKLVKAGEDFKGDFVKGTARSEKPAQPTLESGWWYDFETKPKDVTGVVDELKTELKSGRLLKVIGHISRAFGISSAPAPTGQVDANVL